MPRTLASKIEFVKLCKILQRIVELPAAKKLEELEKFIDLCRKLGNQIKCKDAQADVSLFPIIRLLLPQFERERGPYGLRETALANLYIRIFCLGKNSQDARKLINYKAPTSRKHTFGDFAEIVYWALRTRLSRTDSSMTIEQINSILDKIAEKNAANQSKDQEFQMLAQEMSAFELKWTIRIILKDLNLGMGQRKIFKAYHPDAEDLFDVTSSLRQVCDKLTSPKIRIQYGIEVFSHFKPMLLERCRIEDIGKFFLGHRQSYFVQTKYDGERSQIHMKDGKFKYLSRNGFDITNNEIYGETRFSGGLLTSRIARLLNPDCRSIILDGELMGWHKEKKRFGSKGMSFDVKKMSPTSSHQPCFVAFDIVMYNDELLVNEPLVDRLKLLEDTFTEEEGTFIRSKTAVVSNSEELLKIFNKHLDNNEEGIVLKKCDVIYKPKVREGSGCYKIKAEYSDNLIQDIDLIILGGYYGEGKCIGLINSFLTGVAHHTAADKSENPTEFHAVVAASTGIKIEKLEELQMRFKQHWVKECPTGVIGPKVRPPDLWIHPKNSLILQLRATEMIRSTVYPTGYSLRFPRVVAIREDKPWYNACTTTEFQSFLKDAGMIQKLTKRRATSSDVNNATISKSPKKVKLSPWISVGERFIGVKSSEIVRLTRLLEGKEFCVINGNEEFSKADIEKILLEHGAKVVQNPRDETFCVIIENPKTVKAKNIIRSRKYDVTKLDWLVRATKKENWSTLQDWLPWDLLSSSNSTSHRLAAIYDEYYDNYTCDADTESLQRSLTKAEETITDTEFTLDRYKKMDEELFEDGISHFSLFRGIVGCFDGPSDCERYTFQFMGGIVREYTDDTVTHIFVDRCKKIDDPGVKELKVIDKRWIEDCFRDRKLLPHTEYVINVDG